MGVRFTPIDVDGFPGYAVSICEVHRGDDRCEHLHVDDARALPSALERQQTVVYDRTTSVALLRIKSRPR